jgi:hypothetical protein
MVGHNQLNEFGARRRLWNGIPGSTNTGKQKFAKFLAAFNFNWLLILRFKYEFQIIEVPVFFEFEVNSSVSYCIDEHLYNILSKDAIGI